MLALLGCGAATAQTRAPAAAAATPAEEEIIVTLIANGVRRGEFTVLRLASGDFWIAERDLEPLKVRPVEQARRSWNGEPYFSLEAMGARRVVFNAAELSLHVEFPTDVLGTTRIDLANPPPPIEVGRAGNSTILNYRASARQAGTDQPVHLRLATELNMRFGELLLRQEAKIDTGGIAKRKPVRGASQALWDHRRTGTRVIAGDVVVAGGPFGTAFTGGGISLARVYAITPDVVRQPGARIQAVALAPAQVEVSVDGSPLMRQEVPPGPVTIENLFYYGGARTVRVTVTDATGRREVIEQPFLFTDSVLAQGLHEYSYFLGKRSELGFDEQWRYRENAWQAFHRYGLTDWLTVQAGAEGSPDFASGGAGATVRSNLFGLLSLDALASVDHATSRRAQGWGARYTYLRPNLSFFAARREFGAGFRSFATTPLNPALLEESRLGVSTRLFSAATVSADAMRSRDVNGARSSYAVRTSANLSPRASVHAEYQSTRTPIERDWAFNVYLRLNFDQERWASATARAGPGSRGLTLETGKQLPQGEGVGYRAGVVADQGRGEPSAFGFGSLNWNLKPVALDFNASAQLRGGRGYFFEAGMSGAVVSLPGFVGLTRQVGDGFVLARLGVPQPDVEIYLNSQPQGKTDDQGRLLIPQVGAYGRQDVSLDDKQLPMQYNLASKRVTIAPPFKSGTVVDFGGRRMRALTGVARIVAAGARRPIASRTWTLRGSAGQLSIDTTAGGEFYIEDAPPGRYAGILTVDGKAYSCRLEVPDFPDAVHEAKEGVVCE